MMTPVAVRWRRRKVADERIRLPSGPASAVTTRSATVFITTDTLPKIKNCRNMWPFCRSTNCGMKERKKESRLRIQNLRGHTLPKGASAG